MATVICPAPPACECVCLNETSWLPSGFWHLNVTESYSGRVPQCRWWHWYLLFGMRSSSANKRNDQKQATRGVPGAEEWIGSCVLSIRCQLMFGELLIYSLGQSLNRNQALNHRLRDKHHFYRQKKAASVLNPVRIRIYCLLLSLSNFVTLISSSTRKALNYSHLALKCFQRFNCSAFAELCVVCITRLGRAPAARSSPRRCDSSPPQMTFIVASEFILPFVVLQEKQTFQLPAGF